MTPKWKDVSSYSKGDANRTPKSWEIRLDGARICIHRHIHYSPDVWLMSVHGSVQVNMRELSSKRTEAAQAEALRFVQDLLAGILLSISEVA